MLLQGYLAKSVEYIGFSSISAEASSLNDRYIHSLCNKHSNCMNVFAFPILCVLYYVNSIVDRFI